MVNFTPKRDKGASARSRNSVNYILRKIEEKGGETRKIQAASVKAEREGQPWEYSKEKIKTE